MTYALWNRVNLANDSSRFIGRFGRICFKYTVTNLTIIFRVNATNSMDSTPLHTASCATNFNQEVGSPRLIVKTWVIFKVCWYYKFVRLELIFSANYNYSFTLFAMKNKFGI